jgi:hypothetical protein
MKVVLLVVFVFLSSCARSQHAPGGPYYFESFRGYSLPLHPEGPIAEAEAKSRRAYIVAHYDADGRLVRIEKRLDGRVQWADTYEYHGNKLVRRIGINWEGRRVENRFDQ